MYNTDNKAKHLGFFFVNIFHQDGKKIMFEWEN